MVGRPWDQFRDASARIIYPSNEEYERIGAAIRWILDKEAVG